MLREHVLEYMKVVKSPSYGIETMFQTFDATQGGYVNFKLFPQQKEMLKAFDLNRHNIVAKPRQAGVTTVTAAFLAMKIATATKQSPERVEILANKLDSAIDFLSKIREFLSQIPPWMWGENYNFNKEKEGHIIGKGSAKKLELLNGSYIAARPCTKDSLRGKTPTYLVIDEAAFVEEGKETFAASAAAISTGGKMIMISTPNGMDELYYKTYISALNNENNFNIVRLHWAFDPRYNKDLEWILRDDDLNEIERFTEDKYTRESIAEKLDAGYYPTSTWFRDMCASLNHDRRAIAQELEVKFEGSGANVVAYHIIEKFEKEFIQDPIEKINFDKNLWIWERPIEGNKYIAGVDVATGNEQDYSTYTIINVDTMEQVLEYRGQIKNDDLAKIVFKYSNLYSALTVIDTTGGYADVLVHELKKAEFGHFYVSEMDSDVTFNTDVNAMKNPKIGLKLQKYRHAAITNFVQKVERLELMIRSIRHVNEWKTFIWKNGRADHQRSFNDDLIMSVVLPLWVLESVYDKIQQADKQIQTTLDLWGMPMDTISDKAQELNKGTKEQKKKKYRKYTSVMDPTGQYSWVFN